MYKTGDLSRYLESGDVEPPLLHNCKTLVRRDRNEEQTLVSYIVPEAAERHRFLAARGMADIEDEGVEMRAVTVFQEKYRVMQKEVRGHLKTRLPAYADASEEDSKNWEPLRETQRTIAQKWADLVIYNGAIVHWARTCQDMMTANVLSTLDAMALCSQGKTKTFTFISSISVLDMDHYIKLSEKRTKTGHGAIYKTVITSALNPIPDGVHVIHVTAHPRLCMNEHLSILEYYGYKAPKCARERSGAARAHAPVLLLRERSPGQYVRPKLDDRNAAAVRTQGGRGEPDGRGSTRASAMALRGTTALADIRFIGPPSEKGRPLPEILVDAQAVGGRGAA
ncbi:hypothetical protein F5X98DRAFT_373942 [Xylaria grammica]|nr:hypothetical protein F5X98DRAFT_373942 [Xylaria grammica]